MGPWLIFLKERFPLPAYVLLSGGLALSGWAFSMRPLDVWTLVGFLLVILFFAELRLMDELKDYKKDQIANPTRPLPRGILTPSQVAKAVRMLAGLMAVSAIALCFKSPMTGLLYGAVTLWLWLMFREFYIGAWLEKRMLLYAASHQIILVPLAFFCASLHDPSETILSGRLTAPALAWSLMVLGSFFSYEICRKLDPKAHPILRTYRQIYGIPVSGLLVLITSSVSVGAMVWWMEFSELGWMSPVSLLFSILTPLTYFICFSALKKEKSYKAVETAATLSLAVQIWTPLLARIFA